MALTELEILNSAREEAVKVLDAIELKHADPFDAAAVLDRTKLILAGRADALRQTELSLAVDFVRKTENTAAFETHRAAERTRVVAARAEERAKLEAIKVANDAVAERLEK